MLFKKWLLLGLASLVPAFSCLAKPSQTQIRLLDLQLRHQVLPYWYDTCLDHERGGYLLADHASASLVAVEKQLVAQTRMIWAFSHAHRKGLRSHRRNYLEAARQGYEFVSSQMKDTKNGGYFWTVDLEGKPINSYKIIYGHAFVLYGFVEYYRASGEDQALAEAMALFELLEARVKDDTYGGWIEHFTADWTSVLHPSDQAVVEVAGYKSANTHLHLMEAFSELYDVTRDPRVRVALEESLTINREYFYPREASAACFHRKRDWGVVEDGASQGLSYGHNVEFAWLMVRAQRFLGENLDWPHFYAHLDHGLEFGFDFLQGGMYDRGFDTDPAHRRNKVWWVQAEILAALSDALAMGPRQADRYGLALSRLLGFLQDRQVDDRDGIWLWEIGDDGRVASDVKANSWKTAYHDVRAVIKFLEAFHPRWKA